MAINFKIKEAPPYRSIRICSPDHCCCVVLCVMKRDSCYQVESSNLIKRVLTIRLKQTILYDTNSSDLVLVRSTALLPL